MAIVVWYDKMTILSHPNWHYSIMQLKQPRPLYPLPYPQDRAKKEKVKKSTSAIVNEREGER